MRAAARKLTCAPHRDVPQVYIWFVLYTVCLVAAGFFYRPVGAYVVMFENTTYFFNSSSAFFWALFPIYMSITGSVPLSYDAAMLTFGGLWLEVKKYGFYLLRMKCSTS